MSLLRIIPYVLLSSLLSPVFAAGTFIGKSSSVETWNVTETADETDCGDGITTITYTAIITISDTGQVTISANNIQRTGDIKDNVINFSATYPDDDGITHSQGSIVIVNNNFTGKTQWTWKDGSFTCSGTTALVGKKANATNTSAPTNSSVNLKPNLQATRLIASSSFIEPNNSPQQASPLLVNDKSVIQTLDSVDTEDWFEFYAKAGKRFTIEIPGNSIGKSINPAFQLYDQKGNSLSTIITRTGSNQNITLTFIAPATDLYRVRVVNQALSAKMVIVDNSYQLRVYLTDQPQQGIIKGVILSQCSNRGIGGAEVSSLLNSVVNDNTLTAKNGEFGLPLNPGSYHVKSVANSYQDKTNGPVIVQPDDVTLFQLTHQPVSACTDNQKLGIDIVALQQQAVAVYDELRGLLTIKDIVAGDLVFYVELENIGNYRFQLTRFYPIPGVIHTVYSNYDISSLRVKIPALYAFGKTWQIEMKHDGSWVFDITHVDPK